MSMRWSLPGQAVRLHLCPSGGSQLGIQKALMMFVSLFMTVSASFAPLGGDGAVLRHAVCRHCIMHSLQEHKNLFTLQPKITTKISSSSTFEDLCLAGCRMGPRTALQTARA
jgi:hypothetical protein